MKKYLFGLAVIIMMGVLMVANISGKGSIGLGSQALDTCGNWTVDSPDEECDGGMYCDAHCRWIIPTCGDGLFAGTEQCDDGNTTSGDGCSSSCTIEILTPTTPVCGNGNIESDEQCDDGNTISGDSCSELCALPENPSPQYGVCGNSFMEDTEQCDDGNTTNGDGCSSSCTTETLTPTMPVCGNGSIESDEQCDDGQDDMPFDGCYQCKYEFLPTQAFLIEGEVGIVKINPQLFESTHSIKILEISNITTQPKNAPPVNAGGTDMTWESLLHEDGSATLMVRDHKWYGVPSDAMCVYDDLQSIYAVSMTLKVQDHTGIHTQQYTIPEVYVYFSLKDVHKNFASAKVLLGSTEPTETRLKVPSMKSLGMTHLVDQELFRSCVSGDSLKIDVQAQVSTGGNHQYMSLATREEERHSEQFSSRTLTWKADGGNGDLYDIVEKSVRKANWCGLGKTPGDAAAAAEVLIGVTGRYIEGLFALLSHPDSLTHCHIEKTAKEFVGLTEKVGGFHMACAYPHCTDTPEDPLPYVDMPAATQRMIKDLLGARKTPTFPIEGVDLDKGPDSNNLMTMFGSATDILEIDIIDSKWRKAVMQGIVE